MYLLLTVVKTLTVHIVRMVKKGQNDPIDMAYYNGITSVWEVVVRCPTFAENDFLVEDLFLCINYENWSESSEWNHKYRLIIYMYLKWISKYNE